MRSKMSKGVNIKKLTKYWNKLVEQEVKNG